MRFPSIAALARDARSALFRFPWTLLAGAVAAAAGMRALGHQAENQWLRLMMVALLGLPLTVGLTLLTERRHWARWRQAALMAAGILLLVGFYLIWPGPDAKHDAIRYFQFSAGLHLLVAFLPFTRDRDQNAFWQYNRRLLEAFLRSALFAGVLFFGLAVALAALDKLFGVHVPSETYGRLWVLLAFVASPWIFASGVPRDFDRLREERDYPRSLKVFTQYVLTPLVAVYLVLLTAYLGKIVITGTWPSGWVGYLVASVAVTGVFGFLLVDPLRQDEAEGWIRTYARWLFIGLIPAAVMFLLALWKRAEPYGLTELRVLGFLLGAWLLGLALLYSLRRDFGIRIIPISLALILLLTLYGPVSVTGVSIRSQAERLAEVLASRTGSADSTIASAGREAYAAVDFLLEHHADRELRSVLEKGVPGADSLLAGNTAVTDSGVSVVLESAGLSYVPGETPWRGFLSLRANPDSVALPITGYQYVVAVSGPGSHTVLAGMDTLSVHSDSLRSGVTITHPTRGTLYLPFDALLTPPRPGAKWDRQVPPDSLLVEVARDGMRALLALSWIRAERQEGGLRVASWRGMLYWTGGGE